MSRTTSMTQKGQVTIPKDVRDELGLKPFDRVEIVADGHGGAHLRKAGPSLESVAGMFAGIGLTDEELEDAVREARNDHLTKKYA